MKGKIGIVVGIVVILIATVPFYAHGLTAHDSYLSEPVDSCDSPLDRPSPENVENPAIVGNISRVQSNQSRVKITYQVLRQTPDRDFSIELQNGSHFVNYSDNLQKERDRELSSTLNDSSYWVIYEPGTVWRQAEFPKGSDWIFAPTPIHAPRDSVALQPEKQGFVGLRIILLGEYEKVTHHAGCQKLVVLNPKGYNFNTKSKLRVVDSASRLLDFGRTPSTVRFFAAPYIGGDLEGVVPNYDNEVLIEGSSSVHSPDNVWVHEYVHTKQMGEYGDNLGWINEAAAEYFAARVSLELGLISPLEYDYWLSKNTHSSSEVKLVNAKHEDVAYNWGSVILAESDVFLHESGNRSLLQVYQDLIQYPASKGYDDFESELKMVDEDGEFVNATRETVFRGNRPEPKSAYETRVAEFLPHFHNIYRAFALVGFVLFLTGFMICAQDYSSNEE